MGRGEDGSERVEYKKPGNLLINKFINGPLLKVLAFIKINIGITV